MAVEVVLNTPLADALSSVVQPKLSEAGWSTGGSDDSALGEYIILMLVNGKSQEQIAGELSNDLLSLAPEDTGATDFTRWLFEQVDILNDQLNGVPGPGIQQEDAIAPFQDVGGISRGMNKGPADRDADMGEAMDGVQDGQMCVTTDLLSLEGCELTHSNSPTGPKSMRNPSRNGNKRMIGQISKAMDRSSDAALHRVRPQQGTERINMHNRQPPKGPRNIHTGAPRSQPNGRVGGTTKAPTTGAPLMQMTPQQQMQLMAMYEEQARMMSQIFSPQQQQMFMPGMSQAIANQGFQNGASQVQPPGRSLFDRVDGNAQRQNGNFNRRSQQTNGGLQSSLIKDSTPSLDSIPVAGSEDISSSMEAESSQQKPQEEVLCKFNSKCTKQDCPFAHQSPAAPPGTTVDVNDICPFGAACMNRKCVARHPSPAQKAAYKSEQDCKFSVNCKNPTCPFRHPTMPMCRNGADCRIEGCRFTHVKIMCKFNPCKNPTCPYKHTEGQKGVYPDKVWVADGDDDLKHVSERKFIDDQMGDEELVVPDVKLENIKAEHQAHGSQTSSLEGGVVT